MATIKELIRTEAAGGLSFGNYELDTKSKLSDFEYNGDLYKVKTFRELTQTGEKRDVRLRVCAGNDSSGYEAGRQWYGFLCGRNREYPGYRVSWNRIQNIK